MGNLMGFIYLISIANMTSRPVVSVYKSDAPTEISNSAPMPGVFSAPIRNDLVHFVHSNLAHNRRQGHAVFHKAGQEHSAESWGTGRAVARIPRISGSGTSRAGQATFGNMCRKARMFAPLKIWRKWHAKCNTTQRRHAIATALVMARGHHIGSVPELPLVVNNELGVEGTTTSELIQKLSNLGVKEELMKVIKSKKTRSGKGKYRHSRYVKRAARNIPGVDVCNVNRLNILQLAPGGHLGRFVIYTQDAFEELDTVFGTYDKKSVRKAGYTLPRTQMACADLARIINSDQVQAKLRDIRHSIRVHDKTRKNPLTNKALMNRLNPYAKTQAAAFEKLKEQRH